MATAKLQCGWYGLGSMGLNMAINLQRHLSKTGSVLRYSNRTLSKGKALEEVGGEPVADFQSLVSSCDVIFTMISNDEVLNSLADAALGFDNIQDKIFVDTSTVHPDTSTAVEKKFQSKGAIFVASPVFGASSMAAVGKLIFAMAGPPGVVEMLRPYIDGVMAKSIIDCGEDVSKSSLMKISGNVMVIGLQELISEFQVFAEKTGLGTDVGEKFIADMYGPVMEGYSKRLTSGAYAPPLDVSPGFGVSLAIKDTKHALSIAKSLDMRIPTIETALSNMSASREYAGENLDSSSLYGTLRTQSGLPFWTDKSRQGN